MVESPLEDVEVLKSEIVTQSEGEEDVALDNGDEKVVEKEVMHNIFYFYNEDESGLYVDEKIVADSEKIDVATSIEE